MAVVNRARVRWSGPLGVWLATLRVDAHGMHRDLQATGLTAANAIINLAELYRRHAEPQRNAHATERAPAGRDPDAAGEGGLQRAAAGSFHVDSEHACPCGCGCRAIIHWGQQTVDWTRIDRHGYTYSWNRKTASSAPGEASAIPARRGPGRDDPAYWVGPGTYSVHHNDDGMRVYSWSETDPEIEAPEIEARGDESRYPPPCS